MDRGDADLGNKERRGRRRKNATFGRKSCLFRKRGFVDFETTDELSFIYAIICALSNVTTNKQDVASYNDVLPNFKIPNAEEVATGLEEGFYDEGDDAEFNAAYPNAPDPGKACGLENANAEFVKLNCKEHKFAVNVFHEDDAKLRMHPLIIGFGHKSPEKIVSVIQVKKRGNVFRYVLVENLNSLLRQYYNVNSCERSNYCPKCLFNFSSKERLEKHFKNCVNNKLQVEYMPIEYKRMKRNKKAMKKETIKCERIKENVSESSDDDDDDDDDSECEGRLVIDEENDEEELLDDTSDPEPDEEVEAEEEEEEKMYHNFDQHYAKYPPKLFIFFDFETTVVKTDAACKKCVEENGLRGGRCKCPVGEHTISSTNDVMEMKAACFAYCIVDATGRLLKERVGFCREGRAGEKLVEAWLDDEPALRAYMSNCVPMKWDEESEKVFREAKVCSICEKDLYDEDDEHEEEPVARDHDHMTGQFLGAAHASCNMGKERKQNKVVCVAHNAFNFDISFIVRALGKHRNRISERPNLLPKNSERLRALRFGIFEVIDSLQHLTASLAGLTDSLKQQIPPHTYPIIRQSRLSKYDDDHDQVDESRLECLCSKGFFPYEVFDSVETLENMNDFPPKDAFYSTLSNSECVTEDEYEYARDVYKRFKFNNMLEYCLFYCLLDTLVLGEAFFCYMKTIYNFCGLYAGHFLGTPSLSFAAFFKMTKASLEYINDRSLYHKIETNLRGGLSYTATKYGKADKETKIFYVDLNAMYSTAMCASLPYSDFEYMSEKEIEETDWLGVAALDDGGYGYFLECDLEFPPSIHLEQSAMPMAAEKVTITYDMLSPYSKTLLKQFRGVGETFKERKLTSTFFPRKNYLTHLANLQFYLKHGIELVKIHSVIRFKQRKFGKQYIDLCTEARARSKFKFEIDRYKAM